MQNLRLGGCPPPIIFRPMNAHNFVTDSFHTKKFVADFIQAKCDFRQKTAVLHFRAGGLRVNVRCSSWAHWKACSGLPISVTDLLLVLIELFLLGVTAEAL